MRRRCASQQGGIGARRGPGGGQRRGGFLGGVHGLPILLRSRPYLRKAQADRDGSFCKVEAQGAGEGVGSWKKILAFSLEGCCEKKKKRGSPGGVPLVGQFTIRGGST